MIAHLLQTKLHVPISGPGRVPRPRLVRRLNACLDHRLTLLSAPAGYGKTALLVEWIDSIAATEKDCYVAWLSLDEGENDVVRFWSYVIGALQVVEPDLGEGALALLRSLGGAGLPNPSQAETAVTLLANEIAARDRPLVLVLDDYHLIEEPAIHRGIAFLLERIPPLLHLAIATRADPPLPLSRLRGRGQLVELRAADLCFTRQETTTFMAESMSLNLTSAEMAILNEHTEGWIAGLQMAALALRAQEVGSAPSAAQGTSSFLAGMAQTQRYILDYMADEVLSQQPEPIRSFLLRTSVLDQLHGSLCDALTHDAGETAWSGETTLRYLARTNLFVAPLDSSLEWYRCHPLFADLLRKRLAQIQPELVALLYGRASEWHEQHGLVDQAVHYALAAQDPRRAAQLVEQYAEETLMRSENATVWRWIESLPQGSVLASPRLCLYHAWALLLNGRSPELVEQRLQQARQREPSGDIEDAIAALCSLLAILRGDIAESIRLAQQAVRAPGEDLPQARAFLRGVAANSLGMAYVLMGDVRAAEEAFTQTISISHQTGNVMMAAAALCNLAGLHMVQGHLSLAWANYQQALHLSDDQRGRRLPVAARALMGLGELARERNNLDDATSYLTEAVGLSAHYGEMGTLVCYLTLAHIQLARGNWDQIHELIRKARALAIESRATQMDDRIVDVTEARTWIAEGHLDLAAHWAGSRGLAHRQGAAAGTDHAAVNYNLYEAEQMIVARLYLAQGHSGQALTVLEALDRRTEELGRTRRWIELLGLKALAFQALGRTQEALSALDKALSLAEPEGYVRTFLDQGPPMAHLLYQVIERGTASPYARRLLAAFELQAVRPANPSSPAPETSLAEPLTERELQVLQLIADGRTNREIALALVLSLDTVKGHTRHLYAKLGVHSRTQAVAQARTWGLLPSG
jgi:LuxR family maltose regulon positive regulatory protein